MGRWAAVVWGSIDKGAAASLCVFGWHEIEARQPVKIGIKAPRDRIWHEGEGSVDGWGCLKASYVLESSRWAGGWWLCMVVEL